ncbi:MAG: hypothetical protein V2I82_13580 [Halieaceae bacterium]|nr:hypothetical protein [Halieaceae bacterium]
MTTYSGPKRQMDSRSSSAAGVRRELAPLLRTCSDLAFYTDIDNPALREHIDRVGRPIYQAAGSR